MSPVTNLGNWLREKFMWIKKHTEEIVAEEPNHVVGLAAMSDTDRLAQAVLLKYKLKLVSCARADVYEAGEFKFTTENRYVFLSYKGEKFGILADRGVVELFGKSIQIAWDEAHPPTDKQKAREQRDQLIEEAFKELE